MKFKLDHVAMVYRDLGDALKFFKGLFNAPTEDFQFDDMGLKGAFIELENASLELLSPFREDTAISNFLKKRGEGIHHIALRVSDFDRFVEFVKDRNLRIVDGPRMGAHGKRILFLDPKETFRVLIEIIEE